jgi:Photosystem II complex subunit Ycf12
MGIVTDILGGVNWEAIIQLSMVAAIMISGPIVIFLLAARGGDL